MTVSDDLRAYMERYHMTQSQLARYLGTGQTTLTRWLNGDQPRNLRMLEMALSSPPPMVGVVMPAELTAIVERAGSITAAARLLGYSDVVLGAHIRKGRPIKGRCAVKWRAAITAAYAALDEVTT